MYNHSKILVPLDGSELAEVALPYAEGLAVKFDAEIILLAVEGTVVGESVIPASQLETIKNNNLRYLQHRASILQGKGVNVSSEFRFGDAASEIVDFARVNKVDQIVIATHGRSGLKRWVLGSTADRVIRSTDKPILLIRAKEGKSDVLDRHLFYRVTVPLDGSKEAEGIIPYVEELSAQFQMEVILLQVITERTYVEPVAFGEGFQNVSLTMEMIDRRKKEAYGYLNIVKQRLESQGILVRTMVMFGNAGDKIIDTAQDMDSGLVAMTTHGRSGITRWVYGSVADKLLHAGTTPLLLVRTIKPAE